VVESGDVASIIHAPQHEYTTQLLTAARKTALPPDDELDELAAVRP
jgi:ABC-type dipeptide/oligopeptide/nickel transport system ATPase component